MLCRSREHIIEQHRLQTLVKGANDAAPETDAKIYYGSTLAPVHLQKNRKLRDKEVSSGDEDSGESDLPPPLCVHKPKKKPPATKAASATQQPQKPKRPVDRLCKRNDRETAKAKRQVGRQRKTIENGSKDFEDFEAVRLTLSKALRNVVHLSQYAADDDNEKKGALQPAPQVAKGVLLTRQEQDAAIKAEEDRREEEAALAHIAWLDIMSPRGRTLHEVIRPQQAKSDLRSTSSLDSGLGNAINLRSPRPPLTERRNSTFGDAITGPPRRGERLMGGGMVSSGLVQVGNSAQRQVLQPLPLQSLPRNVRRRTSSASSATMEEDEENDNEPDWSIRSASQAGRAIDYFQSEGGMRHCPSISTTIEELDDGFSDEDLEEDDSMNDLEKDVDAEGETDDEQEDDDDEDGFDDCDSVTASPERSPSPERSWIAVGSPHTPTPPHRLDDGDVKTSTSDSDEDEKVAKSLIQRSIQQINPRDELDEEDKQMIASLIESMGPEPPHGPASSSPDAESVSDSDGNDDGEDFERMLNEFLDDGKENAYHPMFAALSDDSGCYDSITKSVQLFGVVFKC